MAPKASTCTARRPDPDPQADKQQPEKELSPSRCQALARNTRLSGSYIFHTLSEEEKKGRGKRSRRINIEGGVGEERRGTEEEVLKEGEEEPIA